MQVNISSQVTEVPSFGHDATALLESLATRFSIADAAAVKEVERVTNHDVKAIEYVLKERFAANDELSRVRTGMPWLSCFAAVPYANFSACNVRPGYISRYNGAYGKEMCGSPDLCCVLETSPLPFEARQAAHVLGTRLVVAWQGAATLLICVVHSHQPAASPQVSEFTHFACTSEDINNLAHALMLLDARRDHLLPAMDQARPGPAQDEVHSF